MSGAQAGGGGGADPHDLARFLAAQEHVWPRALAELRAGAKRSHWMWFVFPQLEGLGTSAMAQRYALPDLAAARAYLAHPELGARLREGVAATLEAGARAPGLTARGLFGTPDDLKFRSCLTLFAAAAGEGEAGAFEAALDRFYDGPCEATRARLGG